MIDRTYRPIRDQGYHLYANGQTRDEVNEMEDGDAKSVREGIKRVITKDYLLFILIVLVLYTNTHCHSSSSSSTYSVNVL